MSSQELMQDGTVGIEEARKFTGLGRSLLYEFMDSGRLAYVKIGCRRLIPRRALVGLLTEGLSGQHHKS